MNMHTRWAAWLLGLSLLLVTTLANSSTVPVVDAGPDQTIYLGESITLHGTATNDPGAWLWEVISAPAGSNHSLTLATTADPFFSADTAGGYMITAMAENYFGWSDPDALIVTVIKNLDPIAVISASPTSGVNPLTVTFDGTGSYDPLGDALLYDWTFDDGSSGSGAIVTHTYDLPGTYTAILTVVDPLGLLDFTTLEINVSAVPVPPAVWLFGSGLIGLIGMARRKAA